MATGACGINCSVCRLHVSGICSTCGAGNSETGKEKLTAQLTMFGSGCSILSCAVQKGIGYCMRDCDEFPCDKLSSSNHPFSESFLDMQKRRREEVGALPSASWPDTAPQFWKILADENPQYICVNTGATHVGDGVFEIQCLNEMWSLDTAQQQVLKKDGDFGGEWDRQVPFLLLVYMAMAKREPVSEVMIAPRDVLPGKNYFEGRYELHTQDLTKAFGENKEAFLQAAKRIGGRQQDEADVSARFHVFPKVIADYLLWLKDDEFPASVTILFNKNLSIHYPLDATALLLNLLSQRLVFVKEQF